MTNKDCTLILHNKFQDNYQNQGHYNIVSLSKCTFFLKIQWHFSNPSLDLLFRTMFSSLRQNDSFRSKNIRSDIHVNGYPFTTHWLSQADNWQKEKLLMMSYFSLCHCFQEILLPIISGSLLWNFICSTDSFLKT